MARKIAEEAPNNALLNSSRGVAGIIQRVMKTSDAFRGKAGKRQRTEHNSYQYEYTYDFLRAAQVYHPNAIVPATTRPTQHQQSTT
jgi:hypothetical protein